MIHRHVHKFRDVAKYSEIFKRNGAINLRLMLCHYYNSKESHEEVLPFEWYEKAYPTLTKLTNQLKHVDLVDGMLISINDGSILNDDRLAHKLHTLKSLVRVFIGSPMVQKNVRESIKVLPGNLKRNPIASFSKSNEREPTIVNSLTKVSNFLNVSAQQRKVVRHTICPQVTQHRIWTGALDEILNGLKLAMDSCCYDYASKMGQQIVSSCLKFLADVDNSEYGCPSWMQIRTSSSGDSLGSGTWEDLLEMFNDLIQCLKRDKELLYHVGKLEVMKEGLSQIKDMVVDKNIGYNEVRHQQSLVQKKLSSTLGHSSRCLFTLLLYYLYGYVRDIEVDLCGAIHGGGGDGTRFCLYMGRILTSEEEKMVMSGVKQLDRALGLFKFVWETAAMKGVLEPQGHLWCVGAKDRTLTYRGTLFFVHGINL